jgi:mono/diheme cytochrome c family protein
MTSRAGKLALVQALALLVGLAAVSSCDEQILDPMADRQPKSMRYKESDFYADGLSMRAPPEGTVPRERITLNPRLTTGRDPDGPVQPNMEAIPNYVATVPIPVSRKLLELGQKRFNITCATCHGPLADGKSIVATQMALRPPPSLIDPKYVAKPAGYIFEVATKGFGLMASYAAELSVEERWAVVAYLRAVQLSQTTSAGALPPDIRQQLEALPPDVQGAPPSTPPAPQNEQQQQQQHEEEKR